MILINIGLILWLAHLYGAQPYDIITGGPRENIGVAWLSAGEGYHNYHHAFPRDYSASELGWVWNFNFATFLIDAFALIGWAYDRNTTSERVIKARIARTGEPLSGPYYTKSLIGGVMKGIVGLAANGWMAWTLLVMRWVLLKNV